MRLVSRPCREANELLENPRLTSRRANLALLDSEMLEYLIDRRVAYVIDQLQRTKPRKRIRRLHDDAQKRECIFDVCRLRKPDPAKLTKRNARPPELDLQIKRMRTRSKQHCNVTERHALVTQVSNALRDKTRLFVLITRAYNDRRLAAIDTRVKPLLVALFHVADDGVGDVEYRLCAAEVFFELDDLCRRKELRKVEHVAMTGAAKRVDRLKFVADNRDVVVPRGHQFHDLRL